MRPSTGRIIYIHPVFEYIESTNDSIYNWALTYLYLVDRSFDWQDKYNTK